MQPESGFSYTRVSGGVGTTVLKDAPGYLKSIIIPGTYVGTIQIDNATTAAGTVASSQVLSLGLPTTSVPLTLPIDAQCNQGILYRATGTPVVTIVWK